MRGREAKKTLSKRPFKEGISHQGPIDALIIADEVMVAFQGRKKAVPP